MYRIGIYLRVSKEDSLEGESQSISSQRNLLKEFIQREIGKESMELLEFLDDGYSGLNGERPGLKKMLHLVEEEKIDCILVKDFSRLARDYLLLGEYREILFPIHQIRFISVNDGYDSEKYFENNGGLDMQFRGLCYDLYSKDISCKVKSAIRAKKKAGIYVSANTPFGYEKLPYDRHHIRIKEEEANIVKMIFQLAEEGCGVTEIAKKLNIMQIKTPKEFRGEKKIKKKVSMVSGDNLAYFKKPSVYWRNDSGEI